MDIPQSIREKIDSWLNGPVDDATKNEIKRRLKEDPESLIEPFSKVFTFGTGGIREVMDVGTNRLNVYTIRMATQGLANHLLKKRKEHRGQKVVIAYDPRNNSKLFAHEAARTLAGNDIAALVTEDLRPTPYCSFACRYHGADGAIMITASHNRPEYNGYKVYGRDGAQVVDPDASAIVAEVNAVKSFDQIHLAPEDSPLITHIGEETDQAYLAAIGKLQIQPGIDQSEGKDLHIVYSNLHGTGITIMPRALERWGFSNITYVEEQKEPDGNFPTAKSPNPEDPKALKLGTDLLEKTKADLFIATDPDADRIGAAVLQKSRAHLITGNQMACICLDYILSTFQSLNIMPKKGAVVTTIVTTPLFKTIADSYNIPCFEVLTGFKYIGEKIRQWEQSETGHSFLFGAEESYGYLFGTHARDKDAEIMGCLISEIALQAKKEGKNLLHRLHTLYEKYGVHVEAQKAIQFGEEGKGKMETMMETLRSKPPFENAQVIDYLHDDTGLPKSNVLSFELEEGAKFIIRPSGTEPKVKIYGMLKAPADGNIDEIYRATGAKLNEMLESIAQI